MPRNEVEQVGPDPVVVVRKPYVHIGATCLRCGRRNWLMLHFKAIARRPGERAWRCRCGQLGRLGVGS